MGKEGREEERGREGGRGREGAVGHPSIPRSTVHRRGPGEKINNLERG